MLDRPIVEVLSPASHGASSKDDLGDVLIPYEGRGTFRDVFSGENDDLGVARSSKLQVGSKGGFIYSFSGPFHLNVQHKELSTDAFRYFCTSRYEGLRLPALADTNDYALTNSPVRLNLFSVHVRSEGPVNGLRHMLKSEFSEGNQIPTTKEVGQSGLCSFHRVDVTAPHPRLKGLGG